MSSGCNLNDRSRDSGVKNESLLPAKLKVNFPTFRWCPCGSGERRVSPQNIVHDQFEKASTINLKCRPLWAEICNQLDSGCLENKFVALRT